jgi:hypothetical protein
MRFSIFHPKDEDFDIFSYFGFHKLLKGTTRGTRGNMSLRASFQNALLFGAQPLFVFFSGGSFRNRRFQRLCPR